jgi:hypothetical protein
VRCVGTVCQSLTGVGKLGMGVEMTGVPAKVTSPLELKVGARDVVAPWPLPK